MAKRLEVFDDYYVHGMFEDERIHRLYYKGVIKIEYGEEGYVVVFRGYPWKGSIYSPFIKHGISVVLENEQAK